MREPFAPVRLENDQVRVNFGCNPDHRLGECALGRRRSVNRVLHSGQVPRGDLLQLRSRLPLCGRVFVLADLGLANRAKLCHHVQQMQGCAMVGRDELGET